MSMLGLLGIDRLTGGALLVCPDLPVLYLEMTAGRPGSRSFAFSVNTQGSGADARCIGEGWGKPGMGVVR